MKYSLKKRLLESQDGSVPQNSQLEKYEKLFEPATIEFLKQAESLSEFIDPEGSMLAKYFDANNKQWVSKLKRNAASYYSSDGKVTLAPGFSSIKINRGSAKKLHSTQDWTFCSILFTIPEYPKYPTPMIIPQVYSLESTFESDNDTRSWPKDPTLMQIVEKYNPINAFTMWWLIDELIAQVKSM